MKLRYFHFSSLPLYLSLACIEFQSFERQRISSQWNLKPNDTNILYFLGSGPQYRNVSVWAGTQRKASEGVWTVSEQFQNLLRPSSWEPSVILLLTFLLVGKNKTKHLVFLDWGKSIHMSLKRFQKCIWTQWIYFPLWTIFNQVIINTYKN